MPMNSIVVSGLTGWLFLSSFLSLCTKEHQFTLGMAVLSVPRLLCFSLCSSPPGALRPRQVCELGCLPRPEVSLPGLVSSDTAFHAVWPPWISEFVVEE